MKTDLSLDARIKRELTKFNRICKSLPEDRRKIAQTLSERAAFMAISLEDMETTINRDGKMTKMSQGDYEIERAHPLLSAYNAMIKNYTSTIKQICDLLPDSDKKAAGEALMAFAASVKK